MQSISFHIFGEFYPQLSNPFTCNPRLSLYSVPNYKQLVIYWIKNIHYVHFRNKVSLYLPIPVTGQYFPTCETKSPFRLAYCNTNPSSLKFSQTVKITSTNLFFTQIIRQGRSQRCSSYTSFLYEKR